MSTTTTEKPGRLRWRYGGSRDGAWQTLQVDDTDKYKHAVQLLEAHRRRLTKIELFKLVMHDELSGDDSAVTPESNGKVMSSFVQPYVDSLHDCEESWKARIRSYLTDKLIFKIGDKPANRVTQDDIDVVLAWLKSCDCTGLGPGPICQAAKKDVRKPHVDGLGRRTVDRHFAVFKGFFTYLVNTKVIKSSPILTVKYKPKSLAKYNSGVSKEDAHFYMTTHQFQILRRNMAPQYRVLLDFLGETGARFSEATALRVSALKLNGTGTPTALIKWAWKRGDGREPYLGQTKGGSTRIISVRRELADRLAVLIEGKGPDDFVFTSPTGARLDYDNFRERYWDPAVVRAMRCDLHPPACRGQKIGLANLKGPRCADNGGINKAGKPCRSFVVPGWNFCKDHVGVLPTDVSSCNCTAERLMRAPRPHDLRHTHAAQLIKAGKPLKAIANRLGHATVQVLEAVYAGILPEVEDEMALVASLDAV